MFPKMCITPIKVAKGIIVLIDLDGEALSIFQCAQVAMRRRNATCAGIAAHVWPMWWMSHNLPYLML